MKKIVFILFSIVLLGCINKQEEIVLIGDVTAPANQDTVFAGSTVKSGGSAVAIVSSGDAGNTVWLAPSGTTVFTEGSTMTKASGTATSINAPATEGSYKLFVVDPSGNVSSESTATLTVDNTVPANQDTVFANSIVIQNGGSAVTIVSSGDADNTVWFAPSGTTVFTEGATMTKASGTATSINAPATGGNYKLFVVDQAGNVSSESSATLTVDNTAPANQDTVFPNSIVIQNGGSVITIVSSGDANNTVWFAPSGTTVFTEGATMTKALGTATSITAPTTQGNYKLFVVDQAGNVSGGSTATLTVDSTVPTVGTPLLDLSASASSSFTAVWTAGSDNLSTAASLQYQLCYANADFTNDATTAETKTCTGYESNISSKAVSGLTAQIKYYFTVVVKDQAGNKSVYSKTGFYISSAKSYKVSDTGITSCSNGGSTSIPCPSSTEWYYGQDANYPNTPNAPSWTTNGNETVNDIVTGLVWQRCSAGQNSDAECTGTALTYTHANAVSYCDGLSLGGREDWRLPSYEELITITKQGVNNPAVDTAVFPATVSGQYWSSSPYVLATGNAWVVYFTGGNASSANMTYIYQVRCVAGGL